jgi:proteasome lid subunit RPN8/RPN11
VAATLDSLRDAGREGKERVVLWLSSRPATPGSTITEIFVPEQIAEVDYFRIPPSGMRALMAHLRAHRLGLAAQVHSHPGRAFHSRADDRWAIVRHQGALSLVVPNFAEAVMAENFCTAIASYRLNPDDQWLEITAVHLPLFLELT